jgi:hypothetical protein
MSTRKVIAVAKTATVGKNESAINANWSARIPGALAKAEAVLRGELELPATTKVTLTRIEVALAKALWEEWRDRYEGPPPPPPTLRAFVEKVEAL